MKLHRSCTAFFAGALALVGAASLVARQAGAQNPADSLSSSNAQNVAGRQAGTPHEFKKRPKLRPQPARVRPAPGDASAFGAPLANLDAASLAAFDAGRDEFEAIEVPEGGLGPIFNDSSCAACHTAGAVGGSSERMVTRFGRMQDGKFDPLTNLGGSLLQAQAIDPAVREQVPSQANVVALRMSTPLFGAGLIEAIPDLAIEQNALRRKPEGIGGRVSRQIDLATGLSRVGRFGWKAQHATLLAFTADAYLNEMGVTSRFMPAENAPNGRVDLLVQFDPIVEVEDAVDPATGKGDVDHAADFIRFLAPPPALRQTGSAIAGARVFEQVQCASCHTPVMFTGPHPVAALSNKPVPLFSDLLLHDMGSLGDGIAQDGASPREMRTAPLWGLRVRTKFLHDGRASTPRQAIELHAGEAAGSRDRFLALPAAQQQQLLDYLNSN